MLSCISIADNHNHYGESIKALCLDINVESDYKLKPRRLDLISN